MNGFVLFFCAGGARSPKRTPLAPLNVFMSMPKPRKCTWKASKRKGQEPKRKMWSLSTPSRRCLKRSPRHRLPLPPEEIQLARPLQGTGTWGFFFFLLFLSVRMFLLLDELLLPMFPICDLVLTCPFAAGTPFLLAHVQ